MRVVKAKRLTKKDLIGIVSPASTPDDLSTIQAAVNYFEKNGYNVIVGKNVGKYNGYLAGTDDERVEDIHQMFSNKKVKAVFALRGGYGSGRLLDKLNYKLIRSNPKIFVGYSDITAMQLAIFHKTGLITFAGPMPAVDFSNEVSPYTEEMFWAIITSNKKYGRIELPNEEKLFHLTKGAAKGRVIGGNLSTLVSIAGTDFFPLFKEKILLLEEIGELPYRIDRMLNLLRLLKVFKQVKGVILGRFKNCYETDAMKKSLTLGEVMDDYFGKLKIPVVYNFKHGHIKDNITLPIGITINMNAGRGTIDITEGAVS